MIIFQILSIERYSLDADGSNKSCLQLNYKPWIHNQDSLANNATSTNI